jgi:hypothetical protein
MNATGIMIVVQHLLRLLLMSLKTNVTTTMLLVLLLGLLLVLLFGLLLVLLILNCIGKQNGR